MYLNFCANKALVEKDARRFAPGVHSKANLIREPFYRFTICFG